jgi:hypothetical protein
MVDGSIVRVHQHGAAQKNSGRAGPRLIPWWIEYQDPCCG